MISTTKSWWDRAMVWSMESVFGPLMLIGLWLMLIGAVLIGGWQLYRWMWPSDSNAPRVTINTAYWVCTIETQRYKPPGAKGMGGYWYTDCDQWSAKYTSGKVAGR